MANVSQKGISEKMTEKFNFAAGPSTMPQEVLKEIQANMLDYRGTGFSVLEVGHRTSLFRELRDECKAHIKSLLKIPENYDIIFCHGGGRTQFSMVPLNLLGAASSATYIITGSWSDKAKIEAEKYTKVDVPFRSKGIRVPQIEELEVESDSAYIYYCDNETVYGVEFATPPVSEAWEDIPLVADLSSNFMSRPINVGDFGLIWAAVQKNFGIAGLSVVIIRKDLENLASLTTPYLLNYDSYIRNDSVANTPAIFQIYVANLMARWIEKEGGVERMDELAREKSRLIYDVIDENPKLFNCVVDKSSRSRMNVVFRLPNEALDEFFINEASKHGLMNLGGHHSIGGIRASLYNAMPIEGAKKLADFMKEFAYRHRL